MDSQLQIGNWTVNPTLNEISNAEHCYRLEPKSMQLLLLLASAKGELVSRKKIMAEVWKDRVVTEYTLNNLISNLRKQLNEKGSPEAYIITRPKQGYQLIANVDIVPQEPNLQPDNIPPAPLTTPEKVPAVNPERKNKALAYWRSIVVMLFLLVLFLVWQTSEKQPVQLNPSIVVLPFEVFDNEEDISFFADGLAGEIIHQLSVIPNLKVISRTSSFYFKDKNLPLTEIAEQLDVSYALEGSVRKVNDTMRVSLQLVNAQNDTHIWSKVYTASTDNNFSIQQQISAEIAHTIDSSFIEIPADKRIFTPTSSEAFLRVLKGRKLNQSATPDAFIQARDEFLMATLLEPQYAEAYVDLGVSYLMLVQQKKLESSAGLEQASQSINKAIEIDPALASAYAAKGMLHQMNREITEANTAFLKALELNPDLYLALLNYANFLRGFGHYEDAISYYTRAKEVAPVSGAARWGLANSLLSLGRFNESVNQYQQCVTLLSEHLDCLYGYAYTLRLTNQPEAADIILTKIENLANSEDFWFRSVNGFHQLWQGNSEQAKRIYDKLVTQYGYNNDFVISMVFASLQQGTIEQWFSQLLPLVADDAQTKAYLSVHISYAMSAYYRYQCDPVIATFEKIVQHRYSTMEAIDPVANGFNYFAALAYCYAEKGRMEEAETTIKLSENVLANLPDDAQSLGGTLLAKAQIATLKQDYTKAAQLINQLKSMNWQLLWLLDKDPILNANANKVAEAADI